MNNTTILVYDTNNLEKLKQDYSEYKIFGVGLIFNIVQNIEEFEEIDAELFSHSIIDLTALSYENNYFRINIERYIYKLIMKFEDVLFAINYSQKNIILEKIPHFFININEQYLEAHDENNMAKQKKSTADIYIEPLPLSLYDKNYIMQNSNQMKIFSFDCLCSGVDNFNYQFNIDKVKSILESKEINYIVINSVIDLIIIRKDLILAFEIIFRQIFEIKNDVTFLVCSEKADAVKNLMPFLFNLKKEVLKINDESVCSNENNEYLDINDILNKLDIEIKGHGAFKKDFGFSLKKYMFLNKIGERKILSVFLTGESGIGKTEFAKKLSEIMYPKEALIKINFGNYSNEGVLNSLIGSPLGYIGSEDGGELINKMEKSKSKIILIDEFEKATHSVFHFFYEMLEEGKFTDRHGVEHDLDGYIIIFTSNITKKRYLEIIPDPLKSRFDMVYCFVDLSKAEKKEYVLKTSTNLINNILNNTNVKINISCIENEMDSLIETRNLRTIKRKIEDIVIEEYYKNIDCK